MKYPRTSRYRKVVRHGHPRSDSQGHVLTHVVVAEAALGKVLPDGAEIHHVNGDSKDNAPANLVICQDAAYHKLLHVRARIVRAGGNPNTHAICSTCRQLLPKEAFNKFAAHKALGLQRNCRQCQSIQFKAWAAKRKAAKKGKAA